MTQQAADSKKSFQSPETAFYFVGYSGFEPLTPALSRRCSEPTELISLFGLQKYKILLTIQLITSFIILHPNINIDKKIYE